MPVPITHTISVAPSNPNAEPEMPFLLVDHLPGKKSDVYYGYQTFEEALGHIYDNLRFDADRVKTPLDTTVRTNAIYQRVKNDDGTTSENFVTSVFMMICPRE